MKFIFILLSSILTVSSAFCQIRSAEGYKAQSRHLKTAGLILVGVGGGLTLAGTALIVGDKSNLDYNNDKLSARSEAGVWLIAAGITSALGSIPLFVVSRVMHKKASRILRASSFLEIQKVLAPEISGIPLQPFPAVGVKISL
jgi:hypothetical protein